MECEINTTKYDQLEDEKKNENKNLKQLINKKKKRGGRKAKCFEDEKIPTSLSKNAISYLRNNLGFNGVIISDDMVMKGVSDFGEVEACVMGIKAGLNMFIYRNSDSKTIQVIEDILKIAQNDYELQEKIDFSYNNIIELKKRFLNFKKTV